MAPSGGSKNNGPMKSESQQSIVSKPEEEYVVYARRWFILIVIVILNLSNAMTWITFSPIADLTSTYYNINAFKVNVLSLIFMVASVPFGFTASWVLDTYGLRSSILMSAWLNGIGNFLRNVSTFDGISLELRFWILLAGQTLAAISQPFVMFAPTKLAALWFPDSQRATANMLASMANPLGILAANLIAPAMLWVISSPAFLVVVMSTFGVCSSVPPTPPTASAEEDSEPFKEGLKKIAKSKNYWVLCLSFGTGLAVFSAVTSFLDQALCPRGYSNMRSRTFYIPQVQGIIIILVTQFLTQPLSAAQLADSACAQGSGCSSGSNSFTPQDWTVPGLFMNALTTLAVCSVILFMKGDYKRMKAEKHLNAQKVLSKTHL
uniref:Major facilitator superfamily domain-containing protein 7-a n=1 Tax=Magallana gigas TaxID=29159 RepID=K1QVM3_MAGGI